MNKIYDIQLRNACRKMGSEAVIVIGLDGIGHCASPYVDVNVYAYAIERKHQGVVNVLRAEIIKKLTGNTLSDAMKRAIETANAKETEG